ncbi:hypothetical protein CCACVL1_23113, partial [Corchorus capsularis]
MGRRGGPPTRVRRGYKVSKEEHVAYEKGGEGTA